MAPNQAAAAGAGSTDASGSVASGVVEQDAFTLKQLGATSQIALRGTSPLQGVEFGIRGDEVVTNATLTLSGAMSPSLLPDLSNITVTLNDQYVGTIPVNPSQPNFSVTLPVNPVFFQSANHINFRLTGAYTRNCNDMLSGLIWGTVYNSSSLSMTLQHLPPQRDLSQLPLPFFDKHDNRALLLPFVLPANADDDTLRAAAITASWFGELADFRGASFPVSTTPPHGDAVMIVSNGNGGAIPGLPPIQDPASLWCRLLGSGWLDPGDLGTQRRRSGAGGDGYSRSAIARSAAPRRPSIRRWCRRAWPMTRQPGFRRTARCGSAN